MSIRRYGKSIKLIKEFLNKNEVLDIGCGDAMILHDCASKFKLIYGVDIALSKLKRAKASIPNGLYIVADATALPLKPAIVNNIICFELIEHIDEYKKLIQEMGRILKPAGYLLLSTPSFNSPREFFSRKYIGTREHKHIFSEYELKKLLCDSKLKPIKIAYSGFMIPIYIKYIAWVSSTLFLILNAYGILDLLEEILSKLPLLRRINWIMFFVCQKL